MKRGKRFGCSSLMIVGFAIVCTIFLVLGPVRYVFYLWYSERSPFSAPIHTKWVSDDGTVQVEYITNSDPNNLNDIIDEPYKTYYAGSMTIDGTTYDIVFNDQNDDYTQAYIKGEDFLILGQCYYPNKRLCIFKVYDSTHPDVPVGHKIVLRQVVND